MPKPEDLLIAATRFPQDSRETELSSEEIPQVKDIAYALLCQSVWIARTLAEHLRVTPSGLAFKDPEQVSQVLLKLIQNSHRLQISPEDSLLTRGQDHRGTGLHDSPQ